MLTFIFMGEIGLSFSMKMIPKLSSEAFLYQVAVGKGSCSRMKEILTMIRI